MGLLHQAINIPSGSVELGGFPHNFTNTVLASGPFKIESHPVHAAWPTQRDLALLKF